MVLALPIKKRLGPLHHVHVKVRVRHGDASQPLYVSEHADFEVLLTALVEEEFAVSLPQQPRTVLDVGAHIGVTVLVFRRLFPAAKIIAVEPNPHNVRKLKRNVAHLHDVTVVPVALAGADGVGSFDAGASSWSSRLLRDGQDGTPVQVSTRSLDSLVSEFDIDVESCLVKLDAEGIEWEALSNATTTGDFLAIVGDLHRDLLPVSPERFFDLFKGYDLTGRDAPSLFYAIRRDTRATTGI